jgi:hypothetical protein
MSSVVYYATNILTKEPRFSIVDVEEKYIEEMMIDPSDSHCLFSFWLGNYNEE